MKKRFSCVLKLELGAGVCTRSLSGGQLSGVNLQACWCRPRQALAEDLLLAAPLQEELPLYPSFLGETTNDTFWHRFPSHF